LLKYRIINLHLLYKKKLLTDDTENVVYCKGMSKVQKGGFRVREIIVRCPRNCPWNKHCFVCKIQGEVYGDGVILHKCEVTKEDIPIRIRERQAEIA